MTTARRLAAIMAVDVVGYSRLMGEDEAGTATAVRERREEATPIVRSFGGRLVKTMGDGVLVEFPSVVAAVECAIAIQKLFAERNAGLAEEKHILYRVGVNLGDVLVEGDDILGDGVNIATRLEGTAEPGGICLSEDAYRQVRDKVQEDFVDLGEKELKNIARPIRVYAVKSDLEHFAARAAKRGTRSPPPLSIVVLPFANFSGDPEQDYFVDGVTESLTTDLSRISGSVAIGRHTAFTYKGKAIDLKQIGRELNVRYVLEGSVQRGGNRLRVNAQLVDAATGNHIWAERFDKPVVDLLDMQDEIVARLARQLDAVLIAAEARRAERAPDPNSKDLFFQGLAWFNKGLAPNNVMQAQAYFERALAIDADNVDALAWIAVACAQFAGGFAVEDRAAPLAAAQAAATKALSLAPEHALAHFAMSLVFGFSNRVQAAIAEAERSLALDQNFAMAHAVIGLHKLHLDRGEETEAHVQQALRLSPRDAWVFVWLAIAGYAEDFLGRYEKAAAWQRRSIEANGNYPLSHFHLAAALSHLGRLEEARAAARAGLALDPKFTIAGFRANIYGESPTHLAWRERLVDGLRKAGLPEG